MMTREGKAVAKSNKKANTNSNKILKQQKTAKETVEVLDSDDDFVKPNPIVRARSKLEEVDAKTRSLGTRTRKDLISLKNDCEDSDCTVVDELISDSNASDQKLKLSSSTSKPGSSSGNNNFLLDDSKDAWKNLMQRMQVNQKAGISCATNKNIEKSKGKKVTKSGRTVSKVVLPKVFDANIANDDECAIVPKTALVTKNNSEDTNLDFHRSCSPPKRLKMDESPITEEELNHQVIVTGENTEPRSLVGDVPASTTSNVKIPTMFLKPEERAARALEEKLEKAKLCENVCPQEVLAQLAKEPLHYNSAVESTQFFNGNTVKLNDFVPLEDPYGGLKTKQCPFYKKLPGTKFSVDAFNYGLIPGIDVYFLSHYHSDHYIGLTKKFCKTLVCSPPTANLVRMKLGVDEKYLRRLQLNKSYIIDGVEVILISANHCPGSVMFIFKLPNGTIYFHTGDFRFTVDMLDNHFLQGLRIDVLYLDTTYCDPKYDFPTQTDAISELIAAVKRKLDFRPKTLILCGSYLIGKERVYFSLAEALQTKVFMNYEKKRIIHALENPLYDSYVSAKEESAGIHVAQMFSIEPKFLSEYLQTRSQYSHIIGIKPSGWQFSSSGSGTTVRSYNNDTVTIIGVPYSEHSSYSELQHFVKATKPKKIQPTVNVGSAPKRTAMMEHITKWQATG